MFGFDRDKKKKMVPVVAEAEGKQSSRRKIEYLKTLLQHITIGDRIMYHPEYEPETKLQSLVVGYQIDEYLTFTPRDIEFEERGQLLVLVIYTESGPIELTSFKSICFMIPGDNSSHESQLDYTSRSVIGGTGSLAPRAMLTVLSQGGGANVKVDVKVKSNTKLQNGVHKGLQVAALDILLGTLEDHEPRTQTRIDLSLPCIIDIDGSPRVITANLVDYSETAVRFVLGDDAEWPHLDSKSNIRVKLKPDKSKPSFTLHCVLIKERGQERVFKIEQILNEYNKLESFTQFHGLEIKIAMMKIQSADA